MKITLKDELQEGEAMKWWYGKAYRDYDRCVRVAYPVPINLIVQLLRRIYYALRTFYPSKYDEELRKAYHAGLTKYFEERDKLEEKHKKEIDDIVAKSILQTNRLVSECVRCEKSIKEKYEKKFKKKSSSRKKST